MSNACIVLLPLLQDRMFLWPVAEVIGIIPTHTLDFTWTQTLGKSRKHSKVIMYMDMSVLCKL